MKADTQNLVTESEKSLDLLRQRLGWETAEHRLEELNARAEDPDLWNDPAHAVPAFMTVMVMPLTYSIAYGLIAGIVSWFILQALFYSLALCGIERPSFDVEEVGTTKVGVTDHTEDVSGKVEEDPEAVTKEEATPMVEEGLASNETSEEDA